MGGARLLLAIAAVLVLGATIGLAGYVRSASRGESGPPAADRSAVEERAEDRAADRASPAARAPARPTAARAGWQGTGEDVPALPEAPLAEDRFLGAPETPPTPPAATGPAPRPPDPPQAPTDPEPPAADDPRDFEPEPADGQTP